MKFEDADRQTLASQRNAAVRVTARSSQKLSRLHPVEFPAGESRLMDGREGTSEDVADLMLFLASDASRHITGTEVVIDGAQSLLRG